MAIQRPFTDISLPEETVAAFKASLRGALLRPNDDGYNETRTIWNAMIDRRPALIVRCVGVADVINAVNFARTHDLLVAVRGGGHNVAGNAVCDGGIMIDLSPMKSVHVDPVRPLRVLNPVSPRVNSTTRPRPLAWQPPGASYPLRASPVLRWEAASGGSWANTA